MEINPIIQILRFVLLVLAQVFIFDNINFMGFINPYVYILFIILYPVNANRSLFIFLSFLLGLSVDFFNNSGGIHAAACLLIAYLRPVILKFSFGVSYEYNSIKVANTQIGSRFTYVSILVLLHHLVLFSLEAFNLQHILFTLRSTLFSGIFTIILSLLLMILFSKKTA